jgi:hypothetical protein
MVASGIDRAFEIQCLLTQTKILRFGEIHPAFELFESNAQIMGPFAFAATLCPILPLEACQIPPSPLRYPIARRVQTIGHSDLRKLPLHEVCASNWLNARLPRGVVRIENIVRDTGSGRLLRRPLLSPGAQCSAKRYASPSSSRISANALSWMTARVLQQHLRDDGLRTIQPDLV